ncbi:hypothetical protein L2E82_40055 [Cichorium intybus]|uniref:Uncharacterized protein n=1 Tax=Cichorium intybus TaxID=13427 RepID=A0ACB9AK86_CICIN|nr:hypothetical protein L2E82_40055 [Cichorium intybus]
MASQDFSSWKQENAAGREQNADGIEENAAKGLSCILKKKMEENAANGEENAEDESKTQGRKKEEENAGEESKTQLASLDCDGVIFVLIIKFRQFTSTYVRNFIYIIFISRTRKHESSKLKLNLIP